MVIPVRFLQLPCISRYFTFSLTSCYTSLCDQSVRMNLLKCLISSIYIYMNICRTFSTDSSCCKRSETVLDCRNCNLQEVPESHFGIDITELLLSNNNISRISNNSFGSLTSLRKLTLTNNPLKELTGEIFKGLNRLEHIAIGSSTFTTPPSLSCDVLMAFQNVKKLNLLYNYPTEIQRGCLGYFHALEDLEIGLITNSPFGDEFTNLTQLRSLNITHLRNTPWHDLSGYMFKLVPYIKNLRATAVVRSVGPDSFVHFTNLTTLSLLCNNPLQITDVMNAIKNMEGSTLQNLILDGSDNGDSYILTPALLNSSNFANITHLSLKGTFLTSVHPRFFYQLPNLKYLSLGYNYLVPTKQFDTSYIAFQSIDGVQLEALDVSYLYQKSEPNYFYDLFCSDPMETIQSPPEFIRPSANLDTNKTLVSPSDSFKLYIFPFSKYIYAKNFNWLLFQGELKNIVTNDNNIVYVDLSSSGMTSFGLVKGFIKLQALDLSYNRIHVMHVDQFFHFPSLWYLNLCYNDLSRMNLTALFAGGEKLEWLDMAYNNLNDLPNLLLKNLISLEYVSFHGNPIKSTNLNLQTNLRLRELDLSSCGLTSLTPGFLEQLDNLQAKMNHSLSLNVSDNRFECSCQTMYMVEWFKQTEVYVSEMGHLNCKYGETWLPVANLDLNELEEMCAIEHGLPLLVTIIAPLGIFIMMSLASIVIYRLRWHIQWYFYKIRHLSKTKQTDIPTEEMNRAFDAFISYNTHMDGVWVHNVLLNVTEKEWGLKMYIADRDFIAGAPIVDNIVDAIDKSRKTIIVVSPGFVESEWCEFEMQMALVKSRRNLVIIYKEKVPIDKLSKTLRALITTINYIEYSNETAGLRVFWDRLQNSLKT